MPPLHELDPIHFEFLSQMQAGGSFGEALEHQDHRRAMPADALKKGVGEQIVDGSALSAAIIHHGSAMAVVRLLPSG